MRLSLGGFVLILGLMTACSESSGLLAVWVEYDTEVTFVETADDTVTVSHDPNQSLDVASIANAIVCGKLDPNQSSFTLVTVNPEVADTPGELTATLVVNGDETPLFSWSGPLVGGSKSITFSQASLNISPAGQQALESALTSVERTYQIRYHFKTDVSVDVAQFRVVHRVIVGTSEGSCAISN